MKEKQVVIKSLMGSGKKISGTCVPPPDKSLTHRSIFLASLSTKKSQVKNPLLSGDCLSTIHCFKKLGVPIKIFKNRVVISSGEKSSFSQSRKLKAPKGSLNCGNSGTTMRLIAGVLSAQPFTSRLTGDFSLSKRPMKRVIEPLTRMGARIEARKKNYAPLIIHGNPGLKAIVWKTAVASAQVKSSILLAGLFAKGQTAVLEPFRSRDHTERMLKSLGARVNFKTTGSPGRRNRCSVFGGAKMKGLNISIPGDFSSASFFIAAALIVPGSKLTIKSVCLNPTRTGLLNVLKRMGGKIRIKNLRNAGHEPVGDIEAAYSHLKGTTVNPDEIPMLIDEIPILSVIATHADGKTVIQGAGELRIKETDRLRAVANELKKMGAKIQERSDGLIIEGAAVLRGAHLRSYHDHRMAMSMSIAALVAEGDTKIQGFSCVGISFPDFLTVLRRLCVR